MEDNRCTLAFFRWNGGPTELVKLPLCEAKAGDVVKIVDQNRLIQILETIDVVDGGPAYSQIASCCAIYTAEAWFPEGWRRRNNAS